MPLYYYESCGVDVDGNDILELREYTDAMAEEYEKGLPKIKLDGVKIVGERGIDGAITTWTFCLETTIEDEIVSVRKRKGWLGGKFISITIRAYVGDRWTEWDLDCRKYNHLLFDPTVKKDRDVSSSPSRTISLGKRFKVMRQDNYKCRLCGKGADSGTVLEVDHIVAVASGGGNELENLQTLCFECNRGKRDRCI